MSDAVTITVTGVKGSAPRGPGTQMRVWSDRQDGTIGGGALEWEATRIARAMLAEGRAEDRRTFPLGPDLGQCCGGSVTLEFSNGIKDIDKTAAPLWIWGAGHVGRSIAGVMAPFEDREITLIDTSADRMPEVMPRGVMPFVAADMPRAMRHAPDTADHLILTFSHDIDLALCDAVLRRPFASAGLIGSATKWARFKSRLSAMGHGREQIARIACPIGDPSLGKHPQAIALGVAAALITAGNGAAKGERTG